MNWIIDYRNYVTYYNISYTPACPLLSSVNVIVFVVRDTLAYSYKLRELHSGTCMNYTITVRAGNILGESIPVKLINETKPTGNLLFLFYYN